MSLVTRALNLGALKRGRTVLVSSKLPIMLSSDVPIEEERKEDYNPEHYYPVKMGEVFRNSYQVTVKLGYGGNSTVWLARDIRRWKWQAERYVALKICNNDHADRASAEHELKLMERITTMNKSSPGLRFVRTMLDSFEVKGPHGTHICLVYEPLREPIWLLQKRLVDGRHSLELLKATLKCILSGLDYLHSECHIIHTDLKPENILIGLERGSVLDGVVKAEITDPSPRKTCGDRTIYLSRNNFGHPKSTPTEPVITDFDAATRGDISLPLTHFIQPNPYRAPEVILGASWTYSADIWNLGVMLWDLLEGEPLCRGLHPRHNKYTSRAHLALLIGLLGPPPMELLNRGEHTARHFESNGEFKSKGLIPSKYALADSVPSLEGEDRRLFLEFTRKMLQWLPEDRKSAKELLEDPWVKLQSK